MVITDPDRLAAVVLEFDFVPGQIDTLHFLSPAKDTRQELTQRDDHIQGVYRGTDDLRQERTENQMVLNVKKDDFSFVRCQFAAQSSRAFNARKAASDDDDPWFGHSSLSHLARSHCNKSPIRSRLTSAG